jgi:phage recombination protein Bet
MTTAIVSASNQNAIDYTREQVDTIRNTVARGANDSQLALFLQVCKTRGLDPFSRQVHWTSQGIIVGIDGLRAIADRTDRYVPGNTNLEMDGDGRIVAAHVTVKKLVAGSWHEITESAYMAEYSGRSPIWTKMPRVMLSKCAEARALRRAFPSDMSGLYSQEEMDQAGVTVNVPAVPPATVTVSAADRRPADVRLPAAAVVNAVDAEEIPGADAGVASKAGAEIAAAASVSAACAVLKGVQPLLSEQDLIASYDLLLKKCQTAEDANETARMVVEWKNSKAISPKCLETLRSMFSVARAAINGGK